MPRSLPIDPVLPDVAAALERAGRAVLVAPPGAGKTTRVPLALLQAPWRGDGRIVMLEPRRLAARAAARRMAQTLGERVGETVGYRVRLDTRVSARTRIEVVTEGVLTRLLHADPELPGVAAVVFDEFHERSVQADLGLALTLDARAALRPDLRVLVMSATLDGAGVADLLQDDDGEPAPVIESEGRTFPVETEYLKHPPEGRLEDAVADAVRRALAEEPGSVLVFLPGAGEIRRTQERLERGPLPPGVFVAPLYGALPQAEQDRALQPAPDGTRKVVLATDIAETSLTIEGVRVVVDAGLSREPRFSPGSGMTRLLTVPASQAAADQRRGRAGRTQPGVCFRLWTAADQARRAPFADPEILHADLAPLALDLASWGVADAGSLKWLDPPPAAPLAQARDLLVLLGALDGAGRITPHGRRLAGLALHPRLAHLVAQGQAEGHGPTAARLAALLAERDPFRARDRARLDVDVRLRLDALVQTEAGRAPRRPAHTEVHRGTLERAKQAARRWDRTGGRVEPEWAGSLLALAYPDRVAQRTGETAEHVRFRLRSGRTALLDPGQPLADAPFLVVADLDGRAGGARIFSAAPLDEAELRARFRDQIVTEEQVVWDPEAERVVAQRVERLGAVVLASGPLRRPDPQRVVAALADAVRLQGLDALPWTDDARRFRQRLAFAHGLDPAWPDVSDDALLQGLDAWLLPFLYRKDGTPRRGFGGIDLEAALGTLLDGRQRAALKRLAPERIEVPSGHSHRVDYADPRAPVLAVKLQELFGLTETPRVGDGRVPLTLHLLSPARRPVQVTQDLKSFWERGYFDVRKDLRGRYPKHPWPEDPLAAPPTARTKRRR